MTTRYFYDPPHDPITKVHAQLARYPGPFHGVRVSMVNGEATLLGCVRSFYHKQLAQETVGAVDGVEQVNNMLEVL